MSQLIWGIVLIAIGGIFVWFGGHLASDGWKELRKKKQEIPDVKVSLDYSAENYTPGLEVNGIKWQKDYREYIFNILNVSQRTELSDIRIFLEMPWVFKGEGDVVKLIKYLDNATLV